MNSLREDREYGYKHFSCQFCKAYLYCIVLMKYKIHGFQRKINISKFTEQFFKHAYRYFTVWWRHALYKNMHMSSLRLTSRWHCIYSSIKWLETRKYFNTFASYWFSGSWASEITSVFTNFGKSFTFCKHSFLTANSMRKGSNMSNGPWQHRDQWLDPSQCL